MKFIRNFCIIAHIDHGKSTLADRLLELTGTIDKRKMKDQILDQMELERERGITIKLQPVRMKYIYKNSKYKKNLEDGEYELNLIDTPGHVDFTYEVSRSLQAVEGAILVVDATQGVQAQTIANLYLALEQNLEIIPVLNKIDLPAADVEKVSKEIIDLIGCKKEEILSVSAKTGFGVDKLLEAVVERVPGPEPKKLDASQALIFDSKYDDYKGVMAYVRVFSGEFKPDDVAEYIGAKADSGIVELGYFLPGVTKSDKLSEGEIGYIVTGLKRIQDCRVGDTITIEAERKDFQADYKSLALPGFKLVKPMVFAGIFCKEGSDYAHLRESLEKLTLTDSALQYEPESSPALGFGFRCGFLGMLHLEIIQERLKREYDLDLVVTVPSVAYRVTLKHENIKILKQKNTDSNLGTNQIVIHSPQELPDASAIEIVEEPWVKVDIVSPRDYIGPIMGIVQDKMGIHKNTEFFTADSVILHYELPLSAILVDFYDKLKSATKGYATLNYELLGYRQADVQKMDILVAEDPVEALATIVYHDKAYEAGKAVVHYLKDILPRQMFEVKIQAVLNYQDSGKNKGGKIIASSRIPAMRKDVTAKLYGGDVTRKRKLLEKQKKGKKRMKSFGKVDIPAEAYLAVLKR